MTDNTAAHFVVGEQSPPEAWKNPGKPEWPNVLRLELNTNQALDLIARLALALRSPDQPLSVTLLGRLAFEQDP